MKKSIFNWQWYDKKYEHFRKGQWGRFLTMMFLALFVVGLKECFFYGNDTGETQLFEQDISNVFDQYKSRYSIEEQKNIATNKINFATSKNNDQDLQLLEILAEDYEIQEGEEADLNIFSEFNNTENSHMDCQKVLQNATSPKQRRSQYKNCLSHNSNLRKLYKYKKMNQKHKAVNQQNQFQMQLRN